MRKKMYWGIASLILIIGVVGVYFMLQPDPEPETRYKLPTEADIEKAREARKPPPGASPNGHWHGDEWHDEPHEPIVDVEIVDKDQKKPDYIYDPEREKFDGWDPKLVFENGDTKIDFNYFRPMTEEEQAEYERLKLTRNLENYGDNVEAELRLVAIVNIQTKLGEQIEDAIELGRPEVVENLRTEYKKLYEGFPVSN